MADYGSSKNSTNSSLCANNCGFYGNSKHRNLCSVCYSAFLKQKLISNSNSTDEHSNSQPLQIVDGDQNLCSESIEIQAQLPDLKTKSLSRNESIETKNSAAKPRNRCMICKKRIGLLGFNCRCEGLFCSKHRYPEEHSCEVDYQTIGKVILAEQIVECKADKLQFRV